MIAKARYAALLAAAFTAAPCVHAEAAEPAQAVSTSKGQVLADTKGMTLYTFDKDAGGASTCNGGCAKNWPPFIAADAAATGDWTITPRADGSKQWAYKGKPLYTFVKDTKLGDVKGDGFLNNAWHIAKP